MNRYDKLFASHIMTSLSLNVGKVLSSPLLSSFSSSIERGLTVLKMRRLKYGICITQRDNRYIITGRIFLFVCVSI